MSKNPKRLYRSENNKMLAGVCGGLAEYFDIDPVIVRIIFATIILFGGSGILIYFLLWIIVPSESDLTKKSETYIKENVEEVKIKAKQVAGDNPKIILGVILIVIGLIFLFDNFGIIKRWFFIRLWPIILIALGVLLLFKNEDKG